MDKLITVIGTTASGKSDLGITLAQKFEGEIVSCDSRQVYKGLDLGTGKVTKEERAIIPHHLLDIKDINESFSLAEYRALAYEAINDILARKKQPFLVGGTGLYSRAVTEGYNFAEEKEDLKLRADINSYSAEKIRDELKLSGIEPNEGLSPRHLARRLEKAKKGTPDSVNKAMYDVLQLVVTYPREMLYKRIEERLKRRLDEGMVKEVTDLKKKGATDEFLEKLGLEYRYVNRYLNGLYTYEEFYDRLFTEIRHFAKRQMTWFKKEKNAVWLDMTGDYVREAERAVESFLEK